MWMTLAQNTASNSPGPLPPCISGHHEGSVRSIRSGGGGFDNPPRPRPAPLLFRCCPLGSLGHQTNLGGGRGGEPPTPRGPPPAALTPPPCSSEELRHNTP